MAAMKKVRSIILAVALAWVGACKHCSAGQESSDNLMVQAKAATDRHDPDKAIALYRRVVQIDPKASNAYFGLSQVYSFDKKEYAPAEKYIKIALRLAPADFDFHWQYAMVLLMQNRLQQARNELVASASLSHTAEQETRRKQKLVQIDNASRKH
jgi:tetratricopeptide (TPR) repeat protein